MDTRTGRETPTVSVVLPYSDTAAPEAVELYNKTEREVLNWQVLLLYDIMALDNEGLWVHQSFGVSVPRRNGKSELVLARCLWGLKHGERILYTAHRATTAHSIYERLERLCSKADIYIESSFKAFGKEHLYTADTGRVEFRTRTSTGGLGEGYDLLIIDEAQEYTPDQETALKYTVSDSQNPQTILIGTPPTAISAGTVFPKYRDRVRRGRAFESGWAEWSVDEKPHDLMDPAIWYKTNPSMGYHLDERKIRAEYRPNDELDFLIQRLGFWFQYSLKSAITEADWRMTEVKAMPELMEQRYFGIKFGADGMHACLSVASKTKDEKIFVEAYGCRPIKAGVAWILDFIDKADVRKVAVDGKNGIGILQDAMKKAKLGKPEIPSVPQIIKANAEFELAIAQATLIHMEQSAVTQIVSNCEKRAIGSGGGFGYQSILEGADISILDSMILAHWICGETKAKNKQKIDY